MPAFVQPFTLSAGAATGPAATGSFVNVDFTTSNNATVPATLFGSSAAADTGSGNPPFVNVWSNSFVQNTAKTEAGFGLPGMALRINAENALFSGVTPDLAQIDRVSNALPNIIDVNTAFYTITLGGDPNVLPSDFANAAATTANRFRANGIPHMNYEIYNEPDGSLGQTESGYGAIVNAARTALRNIDSTIQVVGPATTFERGGGWISGNLDVMSYHSYAWHNSDIEGTGSQPPDVDDNGRHGWEAVFNRAISDSQNARNDLGAIGKSSVPFSLGEYNLDTTGNDAQMQTEIGAVASLITMYMTFIQAPSQCRYGWIWDWYGDNFFGIIINAGDQPTSNPLVAHAGYALKLARANMPGTWVSSTVVNSTADTDPLGTGKRLRAWATVNGTHFCVMLLNYDGFNSQTGQVALGHWPLNSTGSATIQRFEISNAHRVPGQSSLTVSAGLTASITLPPHSVTFLTP